MPFLQWGLATAIAGIAGTFALLVYMHDGFTTEREFKKHITHAEGEKKRNDDRLVRIEQKIDTILIRLSIPE